MVQINQEKCIGCGLCAADCVAVNIAVVDGKATVKKECMNCGHCVAICPMDAVVIPEYDMDDVEDCLEQSKVEAEKLLHTIKSRRSIRDYKDEKISEDNLQMLVQAGRYTATAKNNQGCTFVFVQEGIHDLKERVWGFIDNKAKNEGKNLPKEFLHYVAFSRQRKKGTDFLFRNAPAVLFITSEWSLDAGLAAQNIETMASSLGMGALYNGYLARIVEEDTELKKWLGIEGQTVRACMLLGYPVKKYKRTAPRKEAKLIIR